MLPSPKVIIVGESPGSGTGDRIIRYSDMHVEYIEYGRQPKRMPPSPLTTIPPVVLEVPPPLVQNRAMKRAAKFGKKPRRRRF